jgi:hypothetical protein
MKLFWKFLSCLLFLVNIPLVANAQGPSLFMGQEDFTARLQLAQREPWAKQSLDALIQRADQFPQSYTERFGLSEAVPPPEGGQWLHWYVCPDTGRHLEFRPPDQNICPDTGKNYAGYPYDHVVYQLRNDDLAEAAVTEGLAYRFTSRSEFATKAATILKQYAKLYPTYALHDNQGKESPNGAKAYSQTLDESIWLIKLAWTYDLIRGADVLTATEKQDIEQNLLRASAETVRKARKEPTFNIQSWINGGIAAVGYTLNDSALVNEAIDGPIGFRHQMHEFVHEGFWIEGAWGYQFYAMRPLTMLAQMASRKGVNLWKEEPSLLGLFHSPLGVVLPNGRLPAFNDSGSPDLYQEAYLYEVAYAATGDPALLTVLGHGPRSNREALLFGVDRLPEVPPVHLKSMVFPEAGFATLRSSTSDLTAVMKFGPHGGAHGHYDKLNFVLFSQGTTLAIDPGTQLYGLPIHRQWDSMTIAHNTISVDQQRQVQSTGKLLNWHAEEGWAAVRADAGPAYVSATLQRTMLLTPEYVVIVDRCASSDGKPHVFDWAYHNAGKETLLSPIAMQPNTSNATANGYQHLLHVLTGETSHDIDLQFVADPSKSKQDNDNNSAVASAREQASSVPIGTPQQREVASDLHLLAAPGTQVLTGEAPGPDLRINVPFVIVRRAGTSVTFASVITTPTHHAASQNTLITLKQLDDHHFQIQGPGFSDSFVDGADFEFKHHAK